VPDLTPTLPATDVPLSIATTLPATIYFTNSDTNTCCARFCQPPAYDIIHHFDFNVLIHLLLPIDWRHSTSYYCSHLPATHSATKTCCACFCQLPANDIICHFDLNVLVRLWLLILLATDPTWQQNSYNFFHPLRHQYLLHPFLPTTSQWYYLPFQFECADSPITADQLTPLN
jgi:hypothetical protein